VNWFILFKITQFFSNNSPCEQLDVWDQLVVFLRFMVLPGNTDATLASDMGPGLGTISKVVNRVKLAILALYEEFVKWPSEEERRQIASNTALPRLHWFPGWNSF
jgi:hypothetical protein